LPEAVPADVITTALYARFRSRQEHTFGEKMLSAVRFGLIRSVTRLRSGDLTKRLVIPALYNLSRTHQQERNDVH
jgi:hypothetical protein